MWKPVIININVLGYHVIWSHPEEKKKNHHQEMLKPALNIFFDKLFKSKPKKDYIKLNYVTFTFYHELEVADKHWYLLGSDNHSSELIFQPIW